MHTLRSVNHPGRFTWTAVLVWALALTACSSTALSVDEQAVPSGEAETVTELDDGGDGAGSTPDSPGGDADSSLADLVTELPSAPVGFPETTSDGPTPVGLRIDDLGIDTASVLAVGVEDNGDMEVPPADRVGWYQFGPSPGQTGSAVLAAHIAFDGQDGVFRHLDQLPIGAEMSVTYDDGSERRFVASDKQQYDKVDLPRDDIFARDGESQLVLITCGGNFNRDLRSYDDNVVVYADPL